MNYYAENGRKGGIARAKKYHKKIENVVMLFYKEPHLNQKEIAEKVGVSQSFVSAHTKGLTKLYLTDKDARVAEGLKRLEIIFSKLSLESILNKPIHQTIKKVNKV